MTDDPFMMPATPKTWEAVVYTSGPVSPRFEDWSNQMQDAAHQAVEGLAQFHKLPMQIIHTRYEQDYEERADSPKRHFVVIYVSEVVVADERALLPGRVDTTLIQ